MANGDDWVRRFHTGTVSASAAGIVDIAPGRSRPIRTLGRLMRLPQPAAGLTARLCIVRRAEGTAGHEKWIRTFGAARLATGLVRVGERGRRPGVPDGLPPVLGTQVNTGRHA
jgi:hypothetical protein